MQVISSTNPSINTHSTTNTIGVVNSAFAVKMLSQNMYSDGILACIRETICNARDAHVVAKQEKPIDIHLPTQNNPKYILRDYGSGLSEDGIARYLNLFSSDKRNSNDVVGAFGLGAASVFAVSTNYSLVSIHQGMKYYYDVFCDADEFKFSLVHSEQTDEESGLIITVPISKNQFTPFVASAKNFLVTFNFPYICNLGIPLLDVVLENENFLYTKTKLNDNINVRMGGVLYPIDIMRPEVSPEIGAVRSIYQYGDSLIINANIGDVSVTPSRESLHYDKHTIIQLNKLFDNINRDFQQVVVAKINECETIFEARKMLQTKYSLFISKDMLYKGVPVFDDVCKIKGRNITLNIKLYHRDNGISSSEEATIYKLPPKIYYVGKKPFTSKIKDNEYYYCKSLPVNFRDYLGDVEVIDVNNEPHVKQAKTVGNYVVYEGEVQLWPNEKFTDEYIYVENYCDKPKSQVVNINYLSCIKEYLHNSKSVCDYLKNLLGKPVVICITSSKYKTKPDVKMTTVTELLKPLKIFKSFTAGFSTLTNKIGCDIIKSKYPFLQQYVDYQNEILACPIRSVFSPPSETIYMPPDLAIFDYLQSHQLFNMTPTDVINLLDKLLKKAD